MTIVEYPGVVLTDSPEAFQEKVETMVDSIVESLAIPIRTEAKVAEPDITDIVYRGTLDEVQEYFIRNEWSDGLPVVPPTKDRVERFLKFADQPPDEVLGVLPIENRSATVWNIAVNGVMAGCRPEYMPILVAIVEAISDPEFRLEDAGSTYGWEPLVIVSGPMVRQLDFNYGQGVMRVGRQANTSIGRFLRLYLRNVAGYRIPPSGTDKGTISYTFNVALAENEEEVRRLGWKTLGEERGFDFSTNLVTVQGAAGISPPIYTAGDKAADHLETMTEVIGQGVCGYWSFTGMAFGRFSPLIVMSPSIASVFAVEGLTKDHVKRHLHEHTKIRASLAKKYARQLGLTEFDLHDLAQQGVVPEEFAASTDPDREVPVFIRPEWINIVVAGDPDRNQMRAYPNSHEGVPVSRKIREPKDWLRLARNR